MERAAASPCRLIEDLLLRGLGGIAILLRHLFESLTLAGILTFARIIRGLAGRLPLAGVDAIAMDFGFVRGGNAEGTDAEEKRGGRGKCGTGNRLGNKHGKPRVLKVMIKNQTMMTVAFDKTGTHHRLLHSPAEWEKFFREIPGRRGDRSEVDQSKPVPGGRYIGHGNVLASPRDVARIGDRQATN